MPGVNPAKFHGLITIDGASNDFAINGVAHSIVQTDYYIRDATTSLVATLEVQFDAELGAAASVSVSDAGIVTIARTPGAAFTVTWTDSRLRDILGFTADLAGANTYTAPRQHLYGWYPNVAASVYDAATGFTTLVAGKPSADTTVRRAMDGTVYSLRFGTYDERRIEFRAVDDQRVYAVGTDPNIALTQFWSDVISRGIRWRFFPDRTDNATSRTYVAAQKTARDLLDSAEYENPTWARLFKLSMEAYAYVGVFP